MQNEYVAPAIVVVGSVESLTAGTSDGNFTDKTFPVNTPKNELTFS